MVGCAYGVDGMMLTGENGSAGIKPRTIATLCTANRTKTGQGSARAADISQTVALLVQLGEDSSLFLLVMKHTLCHAQLKALLLPIKKFYLGGICVT